MTDTMMIGESFDLYGATADLTNGNWGNSYATLHASGGRFGTAYVDFSTYLGSMNKVLPSTVTGGPMIVGGAFNIVAGNLDAYQPLMYMMSNTGMQMGIGLNAANQIVVFRGNFDAILATSTGALSAGWHTIQLKGTVNSATGSYAVCVDGSTSGWPSGSSANTQQQSDTTITKIQWNVTTRGGASAFQDPIAISGSTFLGDYKIIIQANNSDSAVAWTRNTGGTNYSCAQAPFDGSTTYVSAASNLTDTYGVAAPGTTPASVYYVGVACAHQKDTAGTCTIVPALTSGSSSPVTSTGTTLTPSTSWTIDATSFWGIDPKTSAAWIPGGLSNLKVGIARTA